MPVIISIRTPIILRVLWFSQAPTEGLLHDISNVHEGFLPKNSHLRIHQTDNKHDNKATRSTYSCIGLSLPPNCKRSLFGTELADKYRRTKMKEKVTHRQTRSINVKCRFLPFHHSQ